MRRSVACVLLLSLLCVSNVVRIAGHGWMVSPQPRSGGGTGTANASTGSPCGKAGPTTIQGTFGAGATIPVQFMRANGHGTGGPVTFMLSYAAATGTPTAAQFTTGGGATSLGTFTMDTSTAAVQTKSVTLPTTTGNAVIQFHWTAGDGSNWFDCAYIAIAAAGPCATNNGGCSPNAACTGNGDCKCKAGFFGDGKTCTALPSPTPIELRLASPAPATGFQDPFTVNIATALSIDPVRINYDKLVTASSTQYPTASAATPIVVFSITADPASGASGDSPASSLRQMVATGNPLLPATIGIGVAAVAVSGGAPVGYASAPDDSDPHTKAVGLGLGITGAIVIGVLLALLVWHKRRSGGSSKAAHVQHSPAPAYVHSAPVAASPMVSVPITSAAAPASPRRPPPMAAPMAESTPAPATTSPDGESEPTSTAPLQGQSMWIVSTDDAGNTYYYNTHTGVSQWEIPAEFQ